MPHVVRKNLLTHFCHLIHTSIILHISYYIYYIIHYIKLTLTPFHQPWIEPSSSSSLCFSLSSLLGILKRNQPSSVTSVTIQSNVSVTVIDVTWRRIVPMVMMKPIASHPNCVPIPLLIVVPIPVNVSVFPSCAIMTLIVPMEKMKWTITAIIQGLLKETFSKNLFLKTSEESEIWNSIRKKIIFCEGQNSSVFLQGRRYQRENQ